MWDILVLGCAALGYPIEATMEIIPVEATMEIIPDNKYGMEDICLMKTRERVILSVIDFVMFAGFFASIPILKYLQNVGAETITFINVSAGLVAMLGLSMLALAHSLEVVTDKISAWIFMGMIVLSYLGVICDNLSWAVEGSLQYIEIGYILDMGGFLIMPILMVFFWEYQSRVFIEQSQNRGKRRLLISIGGGVLRTFCISSLARRRGFCSILMRAENILKDGASLPFTSSP